MWQPPYVPARARFVPGYDPRLGTLDEQPHGWAGIAHSRVSELYDPNSQFSDYGLITLDRDVGGSNSTGYFHMRATRNDSSQDWLQARRRENRPLQRRPLLTSAGGAEGGCMRLLASVHCRDARLSALAATPIKRGCLSGAHAGWGSATCLNLRTRAAAQGQTVQTAGYPADKPGTMWMQNCTDTDPVDYDYGYFYVECWVFYGQSGAHRRCCCARAQAQCAQPCGFSDCTTSTRAAPSQPCRCRL